jgi:hypothetical protein
VLSGGLPNCCCAASAGLLPPASTALLALRPWQAALPLVCALHPNLRRFAVNVILAAATAPALL